MGRINTMANKPSAPDLHAFLERHRMEDEILYTVVDAAKDYRLASAAREILGEPLRPLLTKAPLFMERVGPYMTPIRCAERGARYLEFWTNYVGENAGLFFFTKSWPQAVRAHLISIFEVLDEERRMFFFRFYDPRVIRDYLPTCTGKECKEFFGPIRCILADGEKAGTMYQYRPGSSSVQIDMESLE